MPWKEVTAMSERKEFIHKAIQPGANIAELCREYRISRKTGYKWLTRYRQEGPNGLLDRSRRPHGQPQRTSELTEAVVMWVREHYKGWGGRKIKHWLEQHDYEYVPSPSTITEILRRYQAIEPSQSVKHRPYQRFEMDDPNILWQMDFKGRVQTVDGLYCYPLAVLDDASRFLLTLTACSDQKQATIQRVLIQIFRTFGLPQKMLMDNGVSWSGTVRKHNFTSLSIWLIRLGIWVTHGKPRHPQTQGKIERLNRSLDQEVLNYITPENLDDAQRLFNQWHRVYNYERPHEALDMHLPASRYIASQRPFPELLPTIEYPPKAIVRQVDISGRLYFHNRRFRVGKSFAHLPVQILPTQTDGEFEVKFLHQPIALLSLRCNNVK